MITSTNSTAIQRTVFAVIVFVVLLAGLNWVLEPDAAAGWLKSMLVLPVMCAGAWLLSRWILHARAPRPDDEAVLRYAAQAGRFFLIAISFFGGMQIIELSFAAAESLGAAANPDLEFRFKGLVGGAMLVVLGNELPKILTPMSLLPGDGATRVSIMRRFVGRAWAITGLVIFAAMLAAPVELAASIRRSMGIVGLSVTVAAILWMNFGPSRSPPRPTATAEE